MNHSLYPRTSILPPSLFAGAMLALAAAGAGCLEQPAEVADEPAEASQASDLTIEPTPGPPILLQTCLTQTADAAMTVEQQPDGTYFSHVVSTGTGYTTGVCPYFVVDVTVPGSYSVGGPRPKPRARTRPRRSRSTSARTTCRTRPALSLSIKLNALVVLVSTLCVRVLFQPLYNGAARVARVNWSWSY